MTPICNFILSHYATGLTLRRISRGVLVQYCTDEGLEPIGYNQVKMWLTMSRYEEEYKEFRKEYALIQKKLLPILIDELREDAEELRFQSVSGKDGIDKIDPRYLDSFRARLAALKFLQSLLRTPKNANPASQARKIWTNNAEGPTASHKSAIVNPQSAINNSPAQNPSNPTTEGQIVNRTSSIVNNPLEVLSSLPGIGINLPKITLKEAESILGSPILNASQYSNDVFLQPVNEFQSEICNPHSAIEFPQSAIVNPKSEILKEFAQSASLSAQISEKQNFANLSENVAELREKSEIVNPTALCLNSHHPPTQTPSQTPTVFRQIPNFHSRPKSHPG